MDVLALAAGAAILIGCVGLLTALVRARCAALLDEWARHGGWRIASHRRVIFRTGPFSFVPGMPVYEVEVTNSAGMRRTAFVQLGDPIASVLSANIAVEWIDAAV